MSKLKYSLLLALTLIFSLFFLTNITQAAEVTPYKGYRAELVSRSYPSIIKAQPGAAMTLEVEFKNTGTSTWYNDTADFVTLDVSEPYLRESPFYHQWWRTWDCPAWLLEPVVRPGETGTFRFAMAMPDEPGMYIENFKMAATNEAWIPGGELTINFKIIDPDAVVTVENGISAPLDDLSEDVDDIGTEDEDDNDISDDSDFNPTRYEDKDADEFEELNVALNINEDDPELGPDVRIGLYSTEQEVILQSEGVLQIQDADDKILARVFDEAVTADFNFSNKFLSLYDSSNKLILKTNDPIRFKASGDDTPIEIVTNKTNTDTWQEYTLFKGVIELRYTDDDSFWIINELSMQDYLKGSAECGTGNPTAYIEAMAIAERTYATQRLLNNGKHSVRGFDLVSHTGDQVYRGYSRELTQPDIAEAVERTNGLVVTYNDEVVITPYFAYSNGWTRTWSEAWGGTDKPWLQPVYVPIDDDGNGRFGHGVGMSATGARDMARNGYNFEEILRYFYTDTEIHKVY